MYIRTSQGKQEFSTCKSIKLIYDHEGMEAGQWVSNPSAELIAAEDWIEYIPPVIPPKPQTEPSESEKVVAMNKMMAEQIIALDDEAALEVIALFPSWADKIGKQLKKNERYYYDEKLWKVLQDHTAQADWTPSTAHSLYTDVSVLEWPEWRQPVGSTDAYNIGDKVSHNGQHWVSIVDGNVWEPSESVPTLWQLV